MNAPDHRGKLHSAIIKEARRPLIVVKSPPAFYQSKSTQLSAISLDNSLVPVPPATAAPAVWAGGKIGNVDFDLANQTGYDTMWSSGGGWA